MARPALPVPRRLVSPRLLPCPSPPARRPILCRSIKRYKSFKDFNKRILVTTDLFGRGIDIERVNIVINYDFPDESNQYLHRIGRAGRFGTKGLAVSFISSSTDAEILAEVQSRFEVEVPDLPDEIDIATYMS